jgi:copper transport protein
MRWRWLAVLVMALCMLVGISGVSAHANLSRSEPPANAVLAQPPDEIRLWFTEPLEPEFSSIVLRDADGISLELPPSQVDPADAFQMFLLPGDLPDGLYTVAWRALSAADGHPSQGSFPITIGAALADSGAVSAQEVETIPADRAIIRWANLLSLALAVGSLGFKLLVWNPAVPESHAVIEGRMNWLVWAGWLLVGVTGVLMLYLQISVATGEPLMSGVTPSILNRVIADTRYGHLWLIRMALWLGMGGALLFARSDRWFYVVALALGLAVLMTNSLFSHASSAQDSAASIGADYLHLVATALWVGGLMQFVNVIGLVRRAYTDSTIVLARLVAYFTNFARASVVILIITGLYAAWLQVGSIEGLVTTLYGQALIVKLILILPLLGIALSNVLYTRQGLKAGESIWAGRLRNLVSAEIALTVGVLAAIGVMTSISPSRTTLAARASVPPPLPDNTISSIWFVDTKIQLDITPGWVGENTFTLTITDALGNPVEDASLIRMRFTSQEQNLGESELRPEHISGGVYRVSGSNLSVPGQWRIRTTVQRPGVFDSVADFMPEMTLPPPAPAPVVVNPNAPLPNRIPVLLLSGVLCLAAGGFFLAENRRELRRGAVPLGAGLVIAAGLFLFNGAQALRTTVAAAQNGDAVADNTPVRLATSYASAYPYLMTAGGTLLEPDASGVWQALPLDAHVNDVYIDNTNNIWAATDAGLRLYQNGEWQVADEVPATRLEQSHGYVFAMGDGGITRLPLAADALQHVLALDVPLADDATTEFVMMGNHTHVVQNGDQVFVSNDLGLSWDDLNAPGAVRDIGINGDGNLVAATDSGVFVWNYSTAAWESALPLPDGQPIDMMRSFNETLYVLADGGLYRLVGRTWNRVELPDAGDVYLQSIAFKYPDTFWVLGGSSMRLWSTVDGANWAVTRIEMRTA